MFFSFAPALFFIRFSVFNLATTSFCYSVSKLVIDFSRALRVCMSPQGIFTQLFSYTMLFFRCWAAYVIRTLKHFLKWSSLSHHMSTLELLMLPSGSPDLSSIGTLFTLFIFFIIIVLPLLHSAIWNTTKRWFYWPVLSHFQPLHMVF